MAKYPRKGTSVLGMNRTTLVWIIVAGLVLSTGSFLLGMYYGYYQGYSARQAEEPRAAQDRPARVADSPDEDEARDDGEFEAVITDEDLSGTDPASADTPGAPETDTSDRSPREDRTSAASGGTDSIAVQPNALSEGRPGDEPTGSDSPAPTTEQPTRDEDAGPEESESEDVEDTNQIVSTSGPTYTIQVVSYVEESRALDRREALREAGHEASITTKKVDGRQRYRVRIGQYGTRQDAQQEAESLKENGVIEDYWISQVTS